MASFFSRVVRLLSFLKRWSGDLRYPRLKIAAIVIASVISGLTNAALVAVINQALTGGRQAMIWIFVGLCVLLPLSRFVSGALLLHLSAQAVYEMRLLLSRRILAAPLRSLEERGPHRLLANLTEDVPRITDALTFFPMLLMQIFIVVGCLGYLAWLSWVALGVVLVFMIFGVITYQLPVRGATRILQVLREGFDGLMKAFRAMIEGNKELKMSFARREAFFAEELASSAEVVRRSSASSRIIFLGATSWGHVLFFVLVGLVLFWLPAYQQFEDRVFSGYVLAILYMMGPLNGLMESVPMLGTAVVAMEKIERLGLSLADTTTEQKLLEPPEPVASWGHLRLAGVTHRYHVETEDTAFTLGPIDLEVKRGELLFLTGGNGSGKTTLAKLLIGLYAPEQGHIYLGDQQITDANREAYRQDFAVVFSDFFVFERLLGVASAKLDREAQGYLEKLLLDKKVQVDAGRLSTVNLSQGQRKRLALLAAYLEDRSIYLFDEWAADQDPEFKRVFYHELLPELKARGKTAIVISHDDRYYDVADRIVKLENGELVDDRHFRDEAPLRVGEGRPS